MHIQMRTKIRCNLAAAVKRALDAEGKRIKVIPMTKKWTKADDKTLEQIEAQIQRLCQESSLLRGAKERKLAPEIYREQRATLVESLCLDVFEARKLLDDLGFAVEFRRGVPHSLLSYNVSSVEASIKSQGATIFVRVGVVDDSHAGKEDYPHLQEKVYFYVYANLMTCTEHVRKKIQSKLNHEMQVYTRDDLLDKLNKII